MVFLVVAVFLVAEVVFLRNQDEVMNATPAATARPTDFHQPLSNSVSNDRINKVTTSEVDTVWGGILLDRQLDQVESKPR